MPEIHVVVTLGLKEHLLQQIAAVDPDLRVIQLNSQQRRLYRGGKSIWYEPYEPPDTETMTPQEAESSYRKIMAQAEVLFTTPLMPANLQELAPQLRWAQSTAAGAEKLLGSPLLRSGITMTTASGIHAIPVGEHVVATMLAFAKNFPAAFDAKQRRAWEEYLSGELLGSTIGIIGLGHIGSHIARLARGFGVRILATRRSAQRPVSGQEAGVPEVDELLPASDLARLLRESDYIAISVPLTRETSHLIGEAELKLMKPSAVIINVSRGPIIDEPALLRALKGGTIRGAALDVFEKEPLPPESELWGLSNVIITPHTSGSTPLYMDRAVGLFCENLQRFLVGQTLLNILDPERGY
ncbi:MAG TPA: D-2-hydroxyacid dehydrogenase [Dehalococcoidia bacterium]|nr:D-2-hydroxyacid dehydrogenase [Dehalococcoidia bacterium]